MSTKFNVYTRQGHTPCYSAPTEAEAHAWARKSLGHGYRVEREALARQPGLWLPVLAAAVVGYLAFLVLYAVVRETRPAFIYDAPLPVGAVILSLRFLPLFLPFWVWRRQKRKRAEFQASREITSASSAPPAAPASRPQDAEAQTLPIRPANIPVSRQVEVASTKPASESSSVTDGPPPATISPSAPTEEHWALALAEFEGATRRPGLYARAFSEAAGVEGATKAKYLAARAQELADEQAQRSTAGAFTVN